MAISNLGISQIPIPVTQPHPCTSFQRQKHSSMCPGRSLYCTPSSHVLSLTVQGARAHHRPSPSRHTTTPGDPCAMMDTEPLQWEVNGAADSFWHIMKKVKLFKIMQELMIFQPQLRCLEKIFTGFNED